MIHIFQSIILFILVHKGKKGYMHNVTDRKGLPVGTVLNPIARRALLENSRGIVKKQAKLSVSIGACEKPHPYKREGNVASSLRYIVRGTEYEGAI